MNQIHVVDNKSTTQARNRRALEIFNRNGFSVRLFGSDQNPMFILNDNCMLSCFLNGNNLHFRPSPDSGEILRTVRLTGDAYITKFEISELIERNEHLPVYRIVLENTELFLVGFNRFIEEEDEIIGRYPVFALHKPMIFINSGKAEFVANEINEKGYHVNII